MYKLNKAETPKIGIVGAMGAIGRNMKLIFRDALCYDKEYKARGHDLEYGWVNSINGLKDCEIVFVCVPTPANKDGSCDVSTVEEVCRQLDKILHPDALIVIRSTVPPGTCARLENELMRGIVFQPEYLGETPDHPMDFDFIILGGFHEDTEKVANAYKTVFNPTIRYYFTDTVTAELTKYMENSFIATKVIFCNQFYELAQKLHVHYNQLRELWLADKRIERWFTDVYPNKRGFDGKCLPKDVKAIVHLARKLNSPLTLMESVLKINEKYHEN